MTTYYEKIKKLVITNDLKGLSEFLGKNGAKFCVNKASNEWIDGTDYNYEWLQQEAE